MSLYKLNELSNELELKEKIKDIRKKNWHIAQAEHDKGYFNTRNSYNKMKDYDRRHHRDHSDPEYKKLRNDWLNSKETLESLAKKEDELERKMNRSRKRYYHAKAYGLNHTTETRHSDNSGISNDHNNTEKENNAEPNKKLNQSQSQSIQAPLQKQREIQLPVLPVVQPQPQTNPAQIIKTTPTQITTSVAQPHNNNSHFTRNALIGTGLAVGGAYGAKKLYDKYRAKHHKKGIFHNLFRIKR